eukprot:2629742-Prymnesium_polylepis.1
MVACPIQCETRPYEQKGSRDLVELLRGSWTMVACPTQWEACPWKRGQKCRMSARSAPPRREVLGGPGSYAACNAAC